MTALTLPGEFVDVEVPDNLSQERENITEHLTLDYRHDFENVEVESVPSEKDIIGEHCFRPKPYIPLGDRYDLLLIEESLADPGLTSDEDFAREMGLDD